MSDNTPALSGYTHSELQSTAIGPKIQDSLKSDGKRLLYMETYVHLQGADKSLARPGRKQATATEDFDVHVFYL
jgi:hypothetical protein